MPSLLVNRLLQALLVLLVMSFVVFVLIGLMPGDPIDLMISANPDITPEDVARLRSVYGLDEPLPVRYLHWLTDLLSGDLGFSRLFVKPVLEVLAVPLGRTLLLMGLSLLVAVVIAIPLGIAVSHRPGPVDQLVNLACFVGISTPPFWLALMLILLFSVRLGWLPASAVPADPDPGLVEMARHLILPVATLSVLTIGGLVRYVRAAMREVLRQPFIRTAQAKGASRWRVLYGHALRSAMLPVVTILALDAGALVSGALITEIMFGYPGMGKLIYDAILGNDYNLALAGLLFATVVTLAANLLADLLYGVLDPRVAERR